MTAHHRIADRVSARVALSRTATLVALAGLCVQPWASAHAADHSIKLAQAEKKAAGARKSGLSISILVNDDPITDYQVERRAAFLAASGGGGMQGDAFKAKAEARWKQIVKDPNTNERFKALLQKHGVKTKEEAVVLQKKYVKELQANMVEQIRREFRGVAVAGSRKKAEDELIEEKLKLQEAKRLNAIADDAEVEKVIASLAERNKMTTPQFAEHLKKMGADIETLRARFKAEMSWREVVRRKFGHQVSITDKEVDQLVAAVPAGGDNEVELQVQRIVLSLAKGNDGAIAQRISEADAVAARFTGCADTASLTGGIQGAKFEDLGTRKPSSIPEPTRSLLLMAADGTMLPPTVSGSGVELWALCGRKVLQPEQQKREMAQGELRQREFDILARRAIKDLRQDAAICSPRGSEGSSVPPCVGTRS